MMDKIIVLDDEVEIADLIELYLKNENYEISKFYSPVKALEYIKSSPADLAILDIMMPEIDGYEVLKIIRGEYNYPVILLSARDSDMDIINGLSIGSDDYITKPFNPLELVARVKAQLRRYKKYNKNFEGQESVLIHKGLVLNVDTHECSLNEKDLILTPTEFKILKILCRRKGQVISSEELFHEIWKNEYYTKNNNTITVHIRNIREKMNDSFENPKYIKTVWGVGYKIEQK